MALIESLGLRYYAGIDFFYFLENYVNGVNFAL